MIWRALGAGAAVLVLFGAAGSALEVTWIPRSTGIGVGADAPPAQVAPAVHAAQRCPHCGRIESKREIVPGVADPHSPRIYEYTLLMSDGSRRAFREALPTSWRVGERLTLIDGQDPALD